METRSWKDVGYRGFGPVIVALSLFLLVWMVLAALTGVLWIVGIALSYVSFMPIGYYLNARVKHRNLARFGVLAIASFIFSILFAVLYRPPPPLLLGWFLLEFISGVTLFVGMSAILCERFLKPRLESKT